jgi:hypothetical protein
MRVLSAPRGYKAGDYPKALTGLIEWVDCALGTPLAALLPSGIQRLTLVMSDWLHSVPWWALQSQPTVKRLPSVDLTS